MSLINKSVLLMFCFTCSFPIVHAGLQRELNTNWWCINVDKVPVGGEVLSTPGYNVTDKLPATVPGTVLTTLLNNHLIPDPFYGMNNAHIPDIYDTGPAYYTYWFVTDFQEAASEGSEQVYLNFRGVNYSCDIYLNGKRVNEQRHYGMNLRQSYRINNYLAVNGHNRLAVLVYPPDPVGNPNGGQGGDGRIAKSLTNQYVAGWDWIPPIRDRNTGIWDKVTIERTGGVRLCNPYIEAEVAGKRDPDAKQQAPVSIKAGIDIENPQTHSIRGYAEYRMAGKVIKQSVVLAAGSTTTLKYPDLLLKNPELWWPNGMGAQALYEVGFRFVSANGRVLDQYKVHAGIRQIDCSWNDHTRSMEVRINGQKLFIKGGNRIVSDALLRFSPERYDAEMRFHRDMNLNLIRVWGGSIIERPEFYDACDKYGLLVFQDFWFSGDCNGRWDDSLKAENQWVRRRYPDDHALSIRSMVDMIRMLRIHPSLAIWCGGNEITPPADILHALKDSLLPGLDPRRCFISFSNSDKMSYNSFGGNGDGPYTIQDPKSFWEKRTYPFNSEVGSVGTGDAESLERFLPPENRVVPDYEHQKIDSVWIYHKDLGYGHSIRPYGNPVTLKEFGKIAQLVNYDQYRALAEGFRSHSWDWYTGFIIWKTQNPWTALRGQMYDYYLDVNACLYGLRKGNEALHIMCNPATGMIMTVNETTRTYTDVMLELNYYSVDGDSLAESSLLIPELNPGVVQPYFSIKRSMTRFCAEKGGFVRLKLVNTLQEVLSENLYWYPDSTGNYKGLQQMKSARLKVTARRTAAHRIEVCLSNPLSNPPAFFNRVSLVDALSGKRLLPVFYDDNYFTVLPGETKNVQIDYEGNNSGNVQVEGWNVAAISVPVAGL